MKKAKVKKQVAPKDEAEVRRWCIEQAIRWPWDSGHHYANAGGLGTMYQGPSEPNILKRADEILKWVRTQAA